MVPRDKNMISLEIYFASEAVQNLEASNEELV